MQTFSIGCSARTGSCSTALPTVWTAPVCGLSLAEGMEQLSLFPEEQKAQRRAAIDRTLDKLRAKYSYFCIRRAVTLLDPALDLDAKGNHIIHPVGFLGTL